MSTQALDQADPAVPFDAPLRYHVKSRTAPHDTYLVGLSEYDGNGICQCIDFQVRFEPLLRRGITPEQALVEKLVKLRNSKGETKDPADALRCWHICWARRQFIDDVIAAMAKKEPHADAPF